MTIYTDKADEVTTALDARFVKRTDIIDNLSTNDATKVLSAKQGKALADMITGIENDMLS